MKIEQYLCGRKRYNGYPIGSNGDSSAGFGCYCRTDDVAEQDIKDLNRYFEYYVCKEKRNDNTEPTILSKTGLQSGNMAVTAQTALHSEGDRSNVISHSYIIPVRHPQAVDPESWFGIPFYRHDINAPTPEEKARRQAAGEQILMHAEDRMPESDFQLKPLSRVMDIWNLSMPMLLGLLEGIIDAVRLHHHNVYIAYNINEMTEDDMEQLLAWLYLLLPYAYRRRAGYDTLHNGASSAHQIVFVATQQLIPGRELRIRSWKSDGTKVQENRIFLERDYLYSRETGELIHNASADELFGRNTPFTRFLVQEIEKLAPLSSIQDCRREMASFDELFKELDAVLAPFETSVEIYDTEIYFRQDMLEGDLNELKKAAAATAGSPEFSKSETLQRRLKSVVNALEKRKQEQDAREILRTLVWDVLQAEEFPSQLDYVDNLAGLILEKPQDEWFPVMCEAQKSLGGRTIQGVPVGDILLWDMLHRNKDFRDVYLRRKFAGVNVWPERIDLSRRLISYFHKSFPDEYSDFTERLSRMIWDTGDVPSPSDIDSLIYLLNYDQTDGGEPGDSLQEMVYAALRSFHRNIKKTEAFRMLEKAGIRLLYRYYQESSETTFDEYQAMNQILYDAVINQWIPGAGRILAGEPETIYMLLEAADVMRLKPYSDEYLSDSISEAARESVDWESLMRFIKYSGNHSPGAPAAADICFRFMRQIVSRAVKEGHGLKPDRLAEAVVSDTLYEIYSDETGEMDSLIMGIKGNPMVDLAYLNDFSDRSDAIALRELPAADLYSSAKDRIRISETIKTNNYRLIRELLPEVFRRLPDIPEKQELVQFKNLEKQYKEQDLEDAFPVWRSKLMKNMELYPSLEELYDFMKYPDEAGLQQLKEIGFAGWQYTPDIEEQRQLLLKTIVNSSPKTLVVLFEEVEQSPPLKKGATFHTIYNKICEGLCRLLSSPGHNNFVNKKWCKDRDLLMLGRYGGYGVYAQAMYYLCCIFQGKKTEGNIIDSRTFGVVEKCYENGKLNIGDDSRLAADLFEMDTRGKIPDRFVIMESPEKVALVKKFFIDHGMRGPLSRLNDALRRYRGSFDGEDLKILGMDRGSADQR